jgi:hypothetical protein
LHVIGRVRYFRNQLGPRERASIPRWRIGALLAGWGLLLTAALVNWGPVKLLVEQGYESRHRAEIVRGSSLTGFMDTAGHQRLVARAAAETSDAALSLTIRFGNSSEPPPAIAVWTETSAGAMIETLFLDQTLAYSEKPVWGGSNTPRHHILPLWRHRYTLVSGVDPNGAVDAFAAATPSHSFTLDDYLVLGDSKSFVLCVEVNAPADPNDAYTNPHIGQPSLLYTAYIELDSDQPYSLLELTGHGGGAEDSGAIQYDLDALTDAKQLVDLLLAKIEPVDDRAVR